MSRLSTRLQRLEAVASPARGAEILIYQPTASDEALRRFEMRVAEALASGVRVIVGVSYAHPLPDFPAGVEVMEAGQAYRLALNAVVAAPRKAATSIPPTGVCSQEEAAALYRQIMLDEVPA